MTTCVPAQMLARYRETDKDDQLLLTRSQMGKILASSPHVWMSQASDSMEDALSQLFMTNSEAPSAKEW